MKKLYIFSAFLVSLILSSCVFETQCPGGHQWKKATCEHPRYCITCGKETGSVVKHTYGELVTEKEADCTENGIVTSTCTVCGYIGKTETPVSANHTYGERTIVKEASCSEKGTASSKCTVCGQEVNEEIEILPHTLGEWEMLTPATIEAKGIKVQRCTVCQTVVNMEFFEKSPEEIRADFITECVNGYTYEEISRYPDNYNGQKAHFKGEIIQVIEYGNSYDLRVNITQGKYTWSDTIYVTYTKKDSSEGRLLDDDIIDMYGTLSGTYTYTTIWGSSVTIPLFKAEYIDLC